MITARASYPSLAGHDVFITGGATGIGAEMVRACAAQGAAVGCIDLDAVAAAVAVATGTAFQCVDAGRV